MGSQTSLGLRRRLARKTRSAAAVLRLLCAYESRNVTFIEPAGDWPIVWDRARGSRVWDAEGREYLDLTAAFGVAAAGHANPRVVEAARQQIGRLGHAMGDVHPHRLKADLAKTLSRITFERWHKPRPARAKTIFCNSGFEAVEAALKTAVLATGRPAVLAFEGGYHGLGYGALTSTHRPYFRQPFASQLRPFASFIPFPETKSDLDALRTALAELEKRPPGAILVEPIQGRGGIRVPPAGFLKVLRRFCNRTGTLLIGDEIFTGFGRTGRWFACEHDSVAPDLICLGKALTGGFPLSACVGEASLMDRAWPKTTGEALHTSTFLGNPVGCAMALAQIREISRRHLDRRSAILGAGLLEALRRIPVPPPYRASTRGRGLMVGLELETGSGQPASDLAQRVIKTMLRRGFILLPEGEAGNVISFTPPLTVTRDELARSVRGLELALITEAAR
ncbi:MAG TPA: aspartate aminotransferase family protein [Verrucomicrobiota bacterium]|nr:aspartate aminotransferase family protein [Verrucomicrobiota bacterium]HNU50006.1 aspartate aminotransferase family protein [Verrucomicrobiota bacterium]